MSYGNQQQNFFPLGNVSSGFELSVYPDNPLAIAAFVGTLRHPMAYGDLIGYHNRRLPLSGAAGDGEHRIDHQSVSILLQRLTHVAEPRLLPFLLLIGARIRIDFGGMDFVLSFFTEKGLNIKEIV